MSEPQAIPCFAQPEPDGLPLLPEGAAQLPEAAGRADRRQASVLGPGVVGKMTTPWPADSRMGISHAQGSLENGVVAFAQLQPGRQAL